MFRSSWETCRPVSLPTRPRCRLRTGSDVLHRNPYRDRNWRAGGRHHTACALAPRPGAGGVRRSSLLEGSRPPSVHGPRCVSPDQRRPSQGLSINHKAVARIMHDNGLQVRPLARFVRTTDSDHGSPRSSPGLEHARIALSPTLLAAIAGGAIYLHQCWFT
jgi:hypothetical protein